MKKVPRQWKAMSLSGIALLFFVAGSLLTASLMHVAQVKADNNRLFELRVYHALPGKLPALESQFRSTTSQLLAKHGLNVVGFWTVPEDASPYWNNTFVFMIAHSNMEEAKKHWAEFLADPAFQAILKAEQTEKKVTKVDRTYMSPTDFSPMK
jgi:hypothetical protein